MKGGHADGFVFPIPKDKVRAYKKMATEGAKIWKQFGALEYYECMGEDLSPKDTGIGKPRSLNNAAKAK